MGLRLILTRTLGQNNPRQQLTFNRSRLHREFIYNNGPLGIVPMGARSLSWPSAGLGQVVKWDARVVLYEPQTFQPEPLEKIITI